MKLSRNEAQERLKTLTGWTLEGDAIRKQFTFAGFPEAVAFVNRLAGIRFLIGIIIVRIPGVIRIVPPVKRVSKRVEEHNVRAAMVVVMQSTVAISST